MTSSSVNLLALRSCVSRFGDDAIPRFVRSGDSKRNRDARNPTMPVPYLGERGEVSPDCRPADPAGLRAHPRPTNHHSHGLGRHAKPRLPGHTTYSTVHGPSSPHHTHTLSHPRIDPYTRNPRKWERKQILAHPKRAMRNILPNPNRTRRMQPRGTAQNNAAARGSSHSRAGMTT